MGGVAADVGAGEPEDLAEEVNQEEARLDVVWSDGSGNVIDGYHDSENLDNDSRHDQQTVTLSTLRYGLERARKLKLRIRFDPD